MTTMCPNALTVDVEDYFHVSAFENVINRQSWDSLESRVEVNTKRVLELLGSRGLTGTFFVLGWVARRHPGLVRAIAADGHEVACHGYSHQRILHQTRQSFRRDVAMAKSVLEDITGTLVRGYRAPSYSITRSTLWALDILIEEGFSYDSSIFPVVHDLYGIPGANPYPHRIIRQDGNILEFPLSTLRVSFFGRTLAVPIAGGGYLRLFPSWFLHWALRRVNTVEGQPVTLYFHPWEIDPGQPRIQACLRSRFRHYLNLDKTEDRLGYMFERMEFAPMEKVLGTLGLLEVSGPDTAVPDCNRRIGGIRKDREEGHSHGHQ